MGETQTRGKVINYPLCYRTMLKPEGNITVVFNPQSMRVVFGDDIYMNRQINALTLELLKEGFALGDTGRFESNGL